MKKAILATLERVTAYYEAQLWDGGPESAPLQYLAGLDKGQRGFTEETLRKFRIGYCPVSPIVATPTDIEILKSIGHVYSNGADMFAGRVTFPIMDQQGRPRGFGARLMTSTPSSVKYINSGSSEVFRKADYLFGMDQARESVWKANNAIVCEGYTDVLAFHQTGHPIAVGPMGTYFTQNQLLLLGQYSMNLHLTFDPDPAGDEATRRSTEMARQMGFAVSQIEFPGGMDPDEYLIHGS